jgi:hypothetical protein
LLQLERRSADSDSFTHWQTETFSIHFRYDVNGDSVLDLSEFTALMLEIDPKSDENEVPQKLSFIYDIYLYLYLSIYIYIYIWVCVYRMKSPIAFLHSQCACRERERAKFVYNLASAKLFTTSHLPAQQSRELTWMAVCAQIFRMYREALDDTGDGDSISKAYISMCTYY